MHLLTACGVMFFDLYVANAGGDNPHHHSIPQPTFVGGTHDLNKWMDIKQVHKDVKSDYHNNSLFGGFPINIRPKDSQFNVSCTIFTVVKLKDCINNCYVGWSNGHCLYNAVYENGVGSKVYDVYLNQIGQVLWYEYNSTCDVMLFSIDNQTRAKEAYLMIANVGSIDGWGCPYYQNMSIFTDSNNPIKKQGAKSGITRFTYRDYYPRSNNSVFKNTDTVGLNIVVIVQPIDKKLIAVDGDSSAAIFDDSQQLVFGMHFGFLVKDLLYSFQPIHNALKYIQASPYPIKSFCSQYNSSVISERISNDNYDYSRQTIYIGFILAQSGVIVCLVACIVWYFCCRKRW